MAIILLVQNAGLHSILGKIPAQTLGKRSTHKVYCSDQQWKYYTNTGSRGWYCKSLHFYQTILFKITRIL